MPEAEPCLTHTDPLSWCPPDRDADGDTVPPIGTQVTCRRRSDGKRLTGTVDENRFGLFLHGTEEGSVVLAASLWDVTAKPGPGLPMPEPRGPYPAEPGQVRSHRRVVIGGLCPRGNGHLWFFHDKDYDGACGSKSWPVYIDVEPVDWAYLPEFIQCEEAPDA